MRLEENDLPTGHTMFRPPVLPSRPRSNCQTHRCPAGLRGSHLRLTPPAPNPSSCSSLLANDLTPTPLSKARVRRAGRAPPPHLAASCVPHWPWAHSMKAHAPHAPS